MKTVRQTRRDARQLFRMCLVGGNVDEDRARFVVQRVLRSKRRGYLGLLEQFQRLLKFENARHRAEIESAVALPSELQAQVRARLEGMYGPGLIALFARNPALIGGVRIRVGSDVYDGSVQAALVALAKGFGITEMKGRNAQSSSPTGS